ncbi:hypothetical protein GCM10009850_117170 [Nonomuraea monospora]|uniref:Uncharacterized protein n=1 Tax=Nonomuraea monospora TaxID=568818 RepID=A0ABN3D324_9ACTN
MGGGGGAGQPVGRGGDLDVQPQPVGLGRDVHVGGPVGGAGLGGGEHGDAAVAEGAQVLQGERHPAAVVEDDLAGRAGDGVADRDDRQRLAQLGPERGGRVDRLHDHAVDALVAELLGQGPLSGRVAECVEDEGVAVFLPQPSADADRQGLLPEVLQRAAQQADHPGAPAGQGSGDGIGLVAELGRGGAHPLHGLLRHLQAA